MHSLKALASLLVLLMFLGCSEGGSSFDNTSKVAPVLAQTALSVDENAAAGTVVGTLTIEATGDSNITSIDLNGTGAGSFTVSIDGEVTVAAGAVLDYETLSVYNLTASALNEAGRSDNVPLTIRLNNLIDLPPTLSNTVLAVNENSAAGSTVGNITIAAVGDSPITSIDLSGTGSGDFTVSTSGAVTVAGGAVLDFEATPVYTFIARAANSAGTGSPVTVTLNVTDVPDIVAALSPAAFGVDENSAPGTAVGSLAITSAGDSAIAAIDLNGTGAANFTVSPAGAITVASGANLDYETATTYSLSARALNAAGYSAYVNVTVDVNDLVDVVPVLAAGTLNIDENSVAGASVGSVTVTTAGDSSIIAMELSGTGAGNFSVSPSGAVTVAGGAGLDYETTTVYNLSVRAQNGAGWSNSVALTINVNNIPDVYAELSGVTLGVDENATAGMTVGNITVTTAGDTPITAIDLNGTGEANFMAWPSGAVTVAGGASLDYETTTVYNLSARALNSAGWGGYVPVTIDVNDVADVVPVLAGVTLGIDENATAGTTVGNITITSTGDRNITTISLFGTGAANFTVSTAGVVTVAGGAALDYETTTSYALSARAQNEAGWSDIVAVTINVNDIADVPPTLAGVILNVDENATAGTTVGNITVTSVGDSNITAIDLNGTGAANFTVSTAGVVTVAGGAGLDYETATVYNLSARAQNSTSWSDYVSVTINVNDIADVVPVLSNSTVSVDENASAGATVGNITITTSGDTPITAIDLNGTGAANFTVSAAGVITVAGGASLDYETTTVYSLSARAQNTAGWSGYVSVTVNVNDVADVVPVLAGVTLNVDENATLGTVVGNITVTSAGDSAITAIDLNGTGASNFTVSTAGEVTVAIGATLDYETTTVYNLSARATNSAGPGGYVSVIINVNDIADVVPVLSSATLNIDEDAADGDPVGNITITTAGDSAITAIDLNGTGAANFTVSTAGAVTVAVGAALDYESVTEYNLSARAQNGAGWSDYVSVTINVNNVPDVLPVLSSAALNVDENTVVGGLVGNITVTSTGDSAVTAIDLNGTGAENFTVATDGVVTVASGGWLDYETTTEYNLSARAQNGAGWSGYVPVNISVNDLAESPQTMPLVLIAISFNDYPIADSDLNWHDKIFGTADGQLNHYYDQVSGGKFALVEANETDGTVNDGIINVALGINHPGNTGMDRNHLVQAVNLANPFIDFSVYDTDFNGAISIDELQIMFIVGGGETSAGDPVASSIWAHAWSLSTSPSAPTVDGVKVMDFFNNGKYSRFGEKHGTHFATIGIIAHELGHAMLDLPDLYDIDDSSAGIGYFGLMGSGSWGYKVTEDPGATPVHMCAWSKLDQGWATPEVVSVTTNNIPMNGTHTGHGNIIKVPTVDPEEYFLIENRSPLGYDAGLYILDGIDFDGGLAIWHIDEGQRNLSNTDNSDETHKLVDLEEANDPELDSSSATRGTRTNLYYGGNSTLFDDTSVPDSKLYDSTSTNISVNNISVVGSAGEEYKITIDISR